jgi:hypothetical protein
MACSLNLSCSQFNGHNMIIKYIPIFWCLLLGANISLLSAQNTDNVWRTLALMKFERQYSENDGIGQQQQGRFISLIEALEAKEITLKGYIVPLSGKNAQSHFMFSAYPYSDCFFCGKAGPESVVEVFTKNQKLITFKEGAITLKGIFRFTSRDPNDIMFTLENAEVVD